MNDPVYLLIDLPLQVVVASEIEAVVETYDFDLEAPGIDAEFEEIEVLTKEPQLDVETEGDFETETP